MNFLIKSYHILIPIILAILMNGIIYTFGLNMDDKIKNEYLPPGYIIGIFWIILLGLLGYIHYYLYHLDNRINFGSLSIVFLIIFCISYPLISSLNIKNGYFLNLVSLILTFIVSLIVLQYSKYAFLFMIPLIVRNCYINLIIYYNLIFNKLKI